jgi:glycosyltransferase involved in cell wall biosynthesis
MTPERPVVSVLIGAYNNEATVARAISSIRDQTERRLELIVLDDGSRDGTAAAAAEAMAADPRCELVRLERNLGVARSLNRGLELASAPVVAIQDADDHSAPQRLERQLATLDADPAVAAIGARMLEVDPDGSPLRPRTGVATGDVGSVLLRFNPIPNGAAAFRRDVVRALGGYDTRYRFAAEYDLWLRIADRHRVLVLDEVLATRVMGSANVAARAERAQTREAIAIRLRTMRRRRSLRGAGGLVRPLVSYATPLGLKRTIRARRGQAP